MPKRENQKTIPGDWLYMTPEDVNIRQLKDALEEASYEVEIWEDAGVLEILLKEKSSMDVETASIHPKDTITQQFANAHQVKNVFLVTFQPDDYEDAERVMKAVTGKFGGFFCGDTEDFTPVVSGQSEE